MNNAPSAAADRWLICEIALQHYAMSVEYVVELVPLRDVTVYVPPTPPPHVEGVVDLRGEPIAVVDVRSVLGMQPMREETEEILEMLRQREADHVKWIEALYTSVRDGVPFQLALDPHQCAFGRWYDALTADRAAVDRFSNGDLALLDIVERFDAPHQRIHGIADHVLALSREGKQDEAEQIIDATRDTDLNAMVELFTKARTQIVKLRRGVIVVLEVAGGRFGAMVDTASEVREISADACQPAGFGDSTNEVVNQIVQDEEHDRLIQLLQVKRMYSQCMADDRAELVSAV